MKRIKSQGVARECYCYAESLRDQCEIIWKLFLIFVEVLSEIDFGFVAGVYRSHPLLHGNGTFNITKWRKVGVSYNRLQIRGFQPIFG